MKQLFGKLLVGCGMLLAGGAFGSCVAIMDGTVYATPIQMNVMALSLLAGPALLFVGLKILKNGPPGED